MFRVVRPSVGASVLAQVDWRHSPLIALISNILWLTVCEFKFIDVSVDIGASAKLELVTC